MSLSRLLSSFQRQHVPFALLHREEKKLIGDCLVNSHWQTFRMPLFPGRSGKASLSLSVDLELFFGVGWGGEVTSGRVGSEGLFML